MKSARPDRAAGVVRPETHIAQLQREFSPRTIGGALASHYRAIRASAVDFLSERIIEPEYRAAIVSLFEQRDPPGPDVLHALSMVPELGQLPISGHVAPRLSSQEPLVRRNAARLLARCFPEACAQQTSSFEHFDVRYELCISQDGNTAVALYRWFLEQGRDPDPAFGLLLTPEWIARHAVDFPDTIERLAMQTGYTGGQPLDGAVTLLESGFWCIPEGLSAADHARLGGRTSEIERMTNQLLGSHRAPDAIPLDLNTPLDFAALCGAARAIDHEMLNRRRFENTLRHRADEFLPSAVCKHATISFCRRVFASDGVQAARDHSVPPELVGKFLIERTCTLLVFNADHRAERALHLKTRWHPKTRKSLGSMSDWHFPIECDADDPQLKLTVLPAAAFAASRRFVEAPSPGARAASNLMHAVGCPELIPILFDFERRHSESLAPIGIEVQTPFTRDREHQSLGWKQALRALGIPSPRRPEYRSMVEASIPPARSFVTPMVIPLLLERAGFWGEPMDLALHMSFSGTLDSRAHELLLAQLVINEPRVRVQRSTQIARLMSKGFLHLNTDAAKLDEVDDGGFRTELRSFRMAAVNGADGIRLRRSYLDDVSDVAMLVAAMRHPAGDVRAIWNEFCDRLERELADLSTGFQELLRMNWWESTGEPRDEDFAREIPVVGQYLKMREWVFNSGRPDELREKIRRLRGEFAQRVAECLGINLGEIQDLLVKPLASREPIG